MNICKRLAGDRRGERRVGGGIGGGVVKVCSEVQTSDDSSAKMRSDGQGRAVVLDKEKQRGC